MRHTRTRYKEQTMQIHTVAQMEIAAMQAVTDGLNEIGEPMVQ